MNGHRSIARVTAHVLNKPVLVTEAHATLILGALRSKLNLSLVEQIDGSQMDGGALDEALALGRARVDQKRIRRGDRMAWDDDYEEADPATKYDGRMYRLENGIAIIPIEGTLMKSWGLHPYSGATGYDGIKTKLIAAMDDHDVQGIYLDIDSPGGVVSGCFDLADFIFAISARNGGKPIWAIANEQMCSAAYALGACADKVFVPRTADIGSVGVLWMYQNVQERMAKEGIKVRIFRAGEDKAEGNPYEEMSEDTAKRVQAELEEIREMFIQTVARGRDLAMKTVRDTRARTYMGQHAVDIRFADKVASDDQVWTQMVRQVGRS